MTCGRVWGWRFRRAFRPEQGLQRLQARAASGLGQAQVAGAVGLEHPQQRAALQRIHVRVRLKLHYPLRKHRS